MVEPAMRSNAGDFLGYAGDKLLFCALLSTGQHNVGERDFQGPVVGGGGGGGGGGAGSHLCHVDVHA